MAIEKTRDSDTGITTFTVSGPLVLGEVHESLREFYADDRDSPRLALWDLREATVDWHSDTVRGLVEWVEANRPPGGGRTALVVTHDAQFGLARMYEIMASDIPVELAVFRDLEAATAWVALETREP